MHLQTFQWSMIVDYEDVCVIDSPASVKFISWRLRQESQTLLCQEHAKDSWCVKTHELKWPHVAASKRVWDHSPHAYLFKLWQAKCGFFSLCVFSYYGWCVSQAYVRIIQLSVSKWAGLTALWHKHFRVSPLVEIMRTKDSLSKFRDIFECPYSYISAYVLWMIKFSRSSQVRRLFINLLATCFLSNGRWSYISYLFLVL